MKPQTIRAAKKGLDRWLERFSGSESAIDDFIAHDPVQFPLRWARLHGAAPGGALQNGARQNGTRQNGASLLSAEQRADIEIAAFLAAAIAWGRRDLIIRSAQKMFAMMEPGPAAFVMSGGHRGLKSRGAAGERCVHRTFFEGDLKYFCRGLKSCYEKYGSLESLFAGAGDTDASANAGADVWQRISLFRREMAAGNKGGASKHVANPDANSACKRVNLALRWLARKGPVDTGLWSRVKPSALCIPLDVHVARNARKLGLLKRKSNDRKAVVELTENLRAFCPEDPIKYDFALFGSAILSGGDHAGS